MYALISWSSKNGVPLKKEELEVQSSTKVTVMNGGKMEPGATVNMVYKKDIWGGMIQSIHGMICFRLAVLICILALEFNRTFGLNAGKTVLRDCLCSTFRVQKT